MMDEREALLAQQIYSSVQDASNNTARSAQQSDFIIGVSDIGVCSERVGRMLDGVPEPRTDKLEAFMGTAVGDHTEAAIAAAFPEAKRFTTVTLELQVPGSTGAYQITGHPDIVMPWGVIDVKTSHFLEVAERTGPTFQQLFQRHAYTKGAHEAGLLAVPLEEAMTANVWIDRSGSTKHFHVQMDNYSEDVVAEGARWLDEVYYSHDHQLRYQKEPPRQWCAVACLAYETEVPTRRGIRQIGDLTDGKHELLVPARQGDGLMGHSSWREVEVRSFGQQALRKITMQRQRATKVVFATPDHEWFVREPSSHTSTGEIVQTDNLIEGMALRSTRKNNSGSISQVPVAILQGFTYGDGTATSTGCSVYISEHSTSKSQTMLPRFFGHTMRRSSRNDGWDVFGLPSLWKRPPDFSESAPFLMSWLAGYFAADGCVTPNSKCSIASTNWESIQLVRSVCAAVGVGYGPVQVEIRQPGSGIMGDVESTLYRVTLVRSTLPDWFLLHEHHRKLADRPMRAQAAWRVVSVEETDRIEEVFCAVVPGEEAFALADDVMTHNCGHFETCRLYDSDVEGLITDEKVLAAVDMYQEGMALNREGKRLQAAAKPTLEGVEGYTHDFQVRWIEVEGGDVAYSRKNYQKLSVTKRGK